MINRKKQKKCIFGNKNVGEAIFIFNPGQFWHDFIKRTTAIAIVPTYCVLFWNTFI